VSRSLPVAIALAALVLAPAAGGHPAATHGPQVLVPRGRPLQIAFANDSGSGFGTTLADAVKMAVRAQPLVRGFRVQVTTVDTPTCGNPPSAWHAAVSSASAIVANPQYVAVIGQVCSFGFAQALPIYERAGIVVISGSATSPSLGQAGPTVFDRTTVNDYGEDTWYSTVQALPSDVAWQQAYTAQFGAAPGMFADLYFDAASLLIRDLRRVSRVDARQNLVVDRNALARAIRGTTAYRGVTCRITLDPSTGDRLDDPAALASCQAGTG
jgi:ABC-type branched-subunit amino acid transport system substrate-binding protein